MRRAWLTGTGIVAACAVTAQAALSSLTWPEVRERFRMTNPALQAARIGVDEATATETTAFLRPNPLLSVVVDNIGHTESGDPFANAVPVATFSYLHERQQKRELRKDSARGATVIAMSGQADLERTMLFSVRSAFVQVLQARAFRALARDNLASYDQVLAIGSDRVQSGDIAQIDLDRLQLQRIQYQTDLQTAEVSLRTAKIQLLRLLNDQQTPVDQFDVEGLFDFTTEIGSLEMFRRVALETRPDLKAAAQAIDKARTDHLLAMANGSTDPTISVDAGFPAVSRASQNYTPVLYQYVGLGLTIPLRIFDRNQGEKLRTQLDITRTQRLADAARLQAFSDVDVAYETVMSTVALLQPYKTTYLEQATRVRDTVTFAYQRGGAALLELLQAQQEYRTVQMGYVNLIGAYLMAAAQLNLAVGQELLP